MDPERRFRIVRRKLEIGLHRLGAHHGIATLSDADVLRGLQARESLAAKRQVGR